MDEVDGRIGLQDVAPGALAGVGLARHQQHAQAVAHAVDDGDGGIVDGAQLVRPPRDLQLDQRRAGMIEVDGDLLVDADRQIARLLRLAVLYDRHLGGGADGALRLVVDAHGHGHVAVDQAVGGRLGDGEAAIDLVGGAGQQQVHGCFEAEIPEAGGNVVHLAVADEDGAGDAARRHVAERAGQRLEQARAAAAGGRAVGAGADHAQLQMGEGADALLDLRQRGRGLLGAVADMLAGAVVDDNDGDVVDIVALFAHDRRIADGAEKAGGRQRAPAGAASAPPQAEEEDQRRGDADPRDQGPGYDRGEFDLQVAEHLAPLPGPSLLP